MGCPRSRPTKKFWALLHYPTTFPAQARSRPRDQQASLAVGTARRMRVPGPMEAAGYSWASEPYVGRGEPSRRLLSEARQPRPARAAGL
jgi:hypothetical protein